MGGATWKRVRIKAPECPRMSAALLEKERTSLGKWLYAQEYLYEFLVMVDQVFSYESVMGAITPEVKPLSGALAVDSVPGGPGPRPEPELHGPIHEGVSGGIAMAGPHLRGCSRLVVARTVIGIPVVDTFRQNGLPPIADTITGVDGVLADGAIT